MSTTMILKRTPGERLAKARHNAGMTQTQLAAKLGIGRRTVNRYESDLAEVPPTVLLGWAHFTEHPIHWLELGAGDDSDIPVTRRVTEQYRWAPWSAGMDPPTCNN